MLAKDIAHAAGHGHGMARHLEVKVIREQGVKLYAEHSALGQQRAMSFHVGEEMLRRFHTREHHRLAKHGAHLRAADVEHVAMSREERQVIVARL